MLGTSDKTSKISKTGFTKIGHIAVSKPQCIGLPSKKVVTNFKVGNFFSYPCLGFFNQNHPNRLLSKGMSNIYLKVTIETFSKLPFSGFKKI